MHLYQQISRNKRKTIFIVAGFVFFVLAVGAAITYLYFGDYISGMILATLFGGGYTLIMLLSSTNVVMKMNHAKEIRSSNDHAYLWNTVDSLSLVAQIPQPRIFIIRDESPNAFATGTSPKKAAVAVTTGLLDQLNREELEGVIAHEIAHVRNYDVRLATIAVALVSAIAILSDIGARSMMYGSRGRRDNKQNGLILILSIVLILLSPLIATLIRLAISRNREFLADATAAELTRNPYALANALKKITNSHTPVKEASSTSASLYFADPLKKKAAGLFSTHPQPGERIKRLEAM
ncbi:zinc metalloprotease HtpX [Alkalicoccobacillus plakortidis]|uniref:Protease HtpX homolog n=1 Tax=Alkalicoccobacillus plakortidis TaxID=444060 RepID=A0ABT0XMZ1_9BACI|nr:zinc metalloprotease HtpX [Alkalicoccobacillus plakortidis]MCM2676693.1 zinc metalloprotease HtpX [Alkalicoccobacillus plakortidis]